MEVQNALSLFHLRLDYYHFYVRVCIISQFNIILINKQ